MGAMPATEGESFVIARRRKLGNAVELIVQLSWRRRHQSVAVSH